MCAIYEKDNSLSRYVFLLSLLHIVSGEWHIVKDRVHIDRENDLSLESSITLKKWRFNFLELTSSLNLNISLWENCNGQFFIALCNKENVLSCISKNTREMWKFKRNVIYYEMWPSFQKGNFTFIRCIENFIKGGYCLILISFILLARVFLWSTTAALYVRQDEQYINFKRGIYIYSELKYYL